MINKEKQVQNDNINYFEELLKMEKSFTNNILGNAGIFIIVWDESGGMIKFNRYGENATGFMEEELLGIKWLNSLMDMENKNDFIKILNGIFSTNTHIEHEGKIRCKNGREIYVLWNTVAMSNDYTQEDMIVSMGVDITKQKEAEKKLISGYQELEAVYEELTATEEELKQNFDELQRKEQELETSEERYRLALEGSRDAIWDWDIKRNESFISERWKEMLGYSTHDLEVSHLTWRELIHPDDRERAFRAQQDHLNGKTPFYSNEYRLKMKNGEYKWILARGKVLRDVEGNPIRIAGSQTDISERKEFEERINFMAFYDSLTGLPNRALFDKLLGESIRVSRKSNLRGAVLFLDLDNFKTVNDTHGHTIGDELLIGVAGLLKKFDGENIRISRFGGDEFVIMVHDVKNDDEVINLASDIVQALNRTWLIKEKEFYNTVSVGIAFYPNDGSNAQNILSNADVAMYSVKKNGKDNFKVYTNEMNSMLLERIELENNLRNALGRNEFFLNYQPQINQRTGEIVGVEALIRWKHQDAGIISPAEFIPVAEETGFIISIGEWVLREACKQNKKWQDMGFGKFSVSVNVSAHQLKHPEFIKKIKAILNETGLEPEWLCLEITESITIADIDFAVKVLSDLRALGINIALDDFGTGYSSMSYLRKMPINIIKIDKSFIDEINENMYSAAITQAIIVMAHKMGLQVVAEGVETLSQHEFLRAENCDMSQGYFFSKPLHVNDVQELFKAGEI